MDIKDINVNMHADDEYLEQLPIMLQGIQQAFPEADSVTKPSVHEHHELTYVRSGQIDYFIYGERYQLMAGSTIVVRPRVPHTFVVVEECEVAVVYLAYNKPKNGDTSEKQINLDPYNEFLSYAEDIKVKDDDEEDLFRYAMMIRGKGRREIASIVESILQEDQQEEYGSVLMLQALTLQLLIQFSRALKEEYEEGKRVRTGQARELVQIAKEYIDNNYDHNISIGDLANHVYLSQGYFARAFRESFGISPLSYLSQVRIEKAATLLEETDIKIASISRKVGFSSPQRFNTAFKKSKGFTPMEFRKNYREKLFKPNID